MESYEELRKHYKKYQEEGLNLNMTRGVPCQEQLNLSMHMMDVLNSNANLISEEGIDCRNYGTLTGLAEAKRLLGDMMEVPAESIIIYGNSSLNVMYDQISRSYAHGVCGSTPWCKLDKVKWLCVVPGYDRHFNITQSFGFENICVPMLEDGPDMDMVEKLVSEDASIKGIWCVPKYSNPTGNSYSDEVIQRFARLKPAAEDFRIYWDNAYTIHHLYEDQQVHILEILGECRRVGNPDIVYKFVSTSKVSFPGSGIAALSASPKNLEDIKAHLTFQTIGSDKVNQLRHVRFFGDIEGMKKHMMKHAEILRPKFEAVERIMEEELSGIPEVSWTKPLGGYFISFHAPKGCAKRIVKLCAVAGVKLTPAGSTYPGKNDPDDSNIRIAPSLPPLYDVEKATRILCLATKLAIAEKESK